MSLGSDSPRVVTPRLELAAGKGHNVLDVVLHFRAESVGQLDATGLEAEGDGLHGQLAPDFGDRENLSEIDLMGGDLQGEEPRKLLSVQAYERTGLLVAIDGVE
jgi:hypothetical protein